jgi:hypothetical protein
LNQLLLALALLCPGHQSLAEPMYREAHRHLIHPVLLAKVVAAESHCRPGIVNPRTHATGLGQIISGRSADRAGHTVDELKDVDLNLYLTAAHIVRCLVLCNENELGAISVYNGGSKKCRATPWSRWVLRGFWQARLKLRRT